MNKYFTLLIGIFFSISLSAQFDDFLTYSETCDGPVIDITSDEEVFYDFTFTPQGGGTQAQLKVRRKVTAVFVDPANPTFEYKSVVLGDSNMQSPRTFTIDYTQFEGLPCGPIMVCLLVEYYRVGVFPFAANTHVDLFDNGVFHSDVDVPLQFDQALQNFYPILVEHVFCFNYTECPVVGLYDKLGFARTRVSGCYNNLQYQWAIDGNDIAETDDRTELLCGVHSYSVTITDPSINCEASTSTGTFLYDGPGCDDPWVPCTTEAINVTSFISPAGVLVLQWNQVSGATKYKITVIRNDSSCCAGDGDNATTQTFTITGTTFFLPAFGPECYSYQITPICANGDTGIPSKKECKLPTKKPQKSKTTSTDNLELGNELTTQIYPNPVVDLLNVETNQTLETATVTIYDMNGRSVLQNNFMNSSVFQIPTSELNAGTYLLKLTEGDVLHSINRIMVVK